LEVGKESNVDEWDWRPVLGALKGFYKKGESSEMKSSPESWENSPTIFSFMVDEVWGTDGCHLETLESSRSYSC
jgi:hypothetical protein